MTIKIAGNWKSGLAFDVHTLSSTYIGPNEFGHDQWENVRSEMGELVYKLKYRNDRSALEPIIALLDKIKGIEQFDYIIPIPPDTPEPGVPTRYRDRARHRSPARRRSSRRFLEEKGRRRTA